MAWTETDRDKLKTAIASASVVRRLKFGEEEYEFRDLGEMKSLLADMEQDIATTAGTSTARYAVYDKGV